MSSANAPKIPLAECLSKICEHCPRVADEVIDLHLAAQRRCAPGKCAKALFRVACEAGAVLPEEVGRILREWKSDLVVEARTPTGMLLERLPFEPEGNEDLEGYCQRVMNVFHWDRSHPSPLLKLSFSYQ